MLITVFGLQQGKRREYLFYGVIQDQGVWVWVDVCLQRRKLWRLRLFTELLLTTMWLALVCPVPMLFDAEAICWHVCHTGSLWCACLLWLSKHRLVPQTHLLTYSSQHNKWEGQEKWVFHSGKRVPVARYVPLSWLLEKGRRLPPHYTLCQGNLT